MQMTTVKVSNISLAVSEKDITEFFCFSGEILYVDVQRESDTTQLAYVTYKDTQGAETAVLLSGATIGGLCVVITSVEDYQLPPEVLARITDKKSPGNESVIKKGEEVVSTMIAKGFVLGKDALNKARELDEKHQIISNASATVASIDQKIGLSEKVSIGKSIVNEKVRGIDERFQVSEKTKSAFSLAEQKASFAGSAIMSNPYVSAGASWVSSAFGVVAKAAEDVSSMTKEKVEKAEEEKKEILYKERTTIVNNFAELHLDESSPNEPPTVPVSSADHDKPITP
uniref:RRM domain-containing protein n=2 Tax=Kalanchoe fedtschenkoi TaxID=63787 RepID=A0A7N0VBZ4_KALFE